VTTDRTTDVASLRSAVLASIVTVAPEVDAATISDDESLRDELDLDSMDFLNVVQGIHDRTGIDVPERDYPQLATLGSAVDYLAGRAGLDGS
jgi:acyl carrier protein